MDEQLAVSLFDTLQIACMAAGAVLVGCAVIPWLLLMIPPLLYVMIWMRQYTTTSMRELKRLDGTTKSPIYSSFSATLSGLVPIRAYGRQQSSQRSFVAKLQTNAQSWYWWLIANRWFGFWLDALCFVVVGAVTFMAVALRETLDPGTTNVLLSNSPQSRPQPRLGLGLIPNHNLNLRLRLASASALVLSQTITRPYPRHGGTCSDLRPRPERARPVHAPAFSVGRDVHDFC